MTVDIQVSYNVKLNGAAAWKIAKDELRSVDGLEFVKIKPYDPALVRFVIGDLIELPKKARPSLGQVQGFQNLIKLRNEAAAESTTDSTPEKESPTAAESLFGNSAKPESKRKPRMNASKLKELRNKPSIMEFTVPGAGENPALEITAIKPIHPCDDFWIRFDAETLEHVVVYIRDQGLSIEDLCAKRAYRSAGAGGGVHPTF